MANEKPGRAEDITVCRCAPRRRRHLRVPVDEAEGLSIEANAAQVGLPVAAYLRRLGLGYEPRGVLDRERVNDMLRINGDLGRLGGLLKLWLSDDARLRQFDEGQIRHAIRAALRKIETTQGELQAVVKTALKGGSD